MANSMIADLLKTPRQVREEEQAQLQAKGLAAQKAILAQGTPSRSLFGGAMQGLASQYASYVPESTETVKRNLMQLGGMDPRSAREVEAVEGRNIARVAMSGDLAKMKEMREELMNKPDVDPRALAALTERIAAEEKRQKPKMEDLSTEAYKEVMKASAGARTARSNVLKANELINRYDRIKPTGGFRGKVSSWINNFLGTQDEQSRLKADFDALVNSAVISNLPPGPATDKDIELIQKGFPDSTWSREEIEGWLEAYRDAAEFQAFYEGERAKYMTANRGLDVDFSNAISARAKKFREAQIARRKKASSGSTGQQQNNQKQQNNQQPSGGITTSPGSNVNTVQTQPGASPGTMTAPVPYSSLQKRSFPNQRIIEQSGTENLGEF